MDVQHAVPTKMTVWCRHACIPLLLKSKPKQKLCHPCEKSYDNNIHCMLADLGRAHGDGVQVDGLVLS